MLYIEIDEEITSIYDRVKNAKQKLIYVVAPRKAIIFQSGVNLQILKRKLEEIGKKLVLITTDPLGKHLAQRGEIEVYPRIEVEEIKSAPEETPQMRIEPIQARRNEVLKDTPKRFTEKKMTIRELISEFRMKDGKRKKAAEESPASFHFVRPNRKFLAFLLVLSASLFMLISYIALPGATILIRPKFDNISHSVNIVLADKRKNQNLILQNAPNIIASETIVIETRQTKVFNTTSTEFEGTNATGVIKVVNSSDEEWPLRADTRFQTPDGIVFRITQGVLVPPATTDEAGEKTPGSLEVAAQADPLDIYGKPVGDRGNIGPTKFVIPGLSRYNQALIWGESEAPMTGGITKYRKIVKEEDVEAAKKQIQDNLLLLAKEDLRTRIDELNKLNHTNLVLLDDRRYLKTQLLDLRISEDLIGTQKEKFEVFAKISAEGVAYDYNQLYALLKREIITRTHPDMRIREDSIQPDTISYEVIEEDPVLGQIKITATIKGIEEFVIDDSQEAGVRFGNKVRDKVLGLPLQEAQSLIANMSEVDAVQIKTWPIWLSNMPRIPENIDIKLMSRAND